MSYFVTEMITLSSFRNFRQGYAHFFITIQKLRPCKTCLPLPQILDIFSTDYFPPKEVILIEISL